MLLNIGPETRNVSGADGVDGASKLSKSENFVICCCFLGWYHRLSLAHDVQDVRPRMGVPPPPQKNTFPEKSALD